MSSWRAPNVAQHFDPGAARMLAALDVDKRWNVEMGAERGVPIDESSSTRRLDPGSRVLMASVGQIMRNPTGD